MNWFERVVGFREGPFAETQARLRVMDGRLHSDVSERSFAVGTLELISLKALRDAAALRSSSGKLRFSGVEGDVRQLHRVPEYALALFQVASQFNLLEMVSPRVSPEAGVSGYEFDRTQGPACAIAAGAGTIFRNYLVPHAAQIGQTETSQLDASRDLRLELARQMKTEPDALWQVRNGYALPDVAALEAVAHHISGLSESQRDHLRSTLNVGLHRNVEVTLNAPEPGQLVSQCYCSAMPVAYSGIGPETWTPLASLVLEAAYEATLLAGLCNSVRGGTNIVLLTRLGGGAFGNDDAWIDLAIERATALFANRDLDVRMVTYRAG